MAGTSSHSHSQSVTIACPECGRELTAPVWLIVDAADRPDLLEMACADRLHELTCTCGRKTHLDAPLLLFLPDRNQPLLFSPAHGASEEQNREQAADFLIKWEKMSFHALVASALAHRIQLFKKPSESPSGKISTTTKKE